ncbi:MAG TPA: pilus assembly protein PilP [Candidatus Thiothrix moscowensis]|uniref:pilus assembly protein PilP n=1 Tax=unclassified Thiothrix TaxID=2636184 RepID=UPI0025F97779|nr:MULTISPECIES: pilus assembly protein PilP [unclassified Thiothrix]HRJ51725.1 pilus assembly protein PilP [Candidatus Thiothrix moscowensis]HRJ92040.1 pilus assembly protein PilP [Candidatus Thiothrix moscowensis]
MMKQHHSRQTAGGIKLSAGLVLLASLAGCTQDSTDLDQYMASVKARPPAQIEPIPEIKPYVRFIYPGHDIDPFDADILKPDVAPGADGGVSPDPNRVPEFLEGFPLDGLRMVGTVYQGKDLWALIRIPDGAVHRVKVGNYMGKNHGKVTKVEETKVALLELVENGFGGYKEQENTIALSDDLSAKK